jgi:hypothetical protein
LIARMPIIFLSLISARAGNSDFKAA